MHTHDGYAPHSHEVRADHLGVPKVDSPDYAAYMAKQSQPNRQETRRTPCASRRAAASQ